MRQAAFSSEILHQLSLPLIDLCGHKDGDLDQLIASSSIDQQSFSADTEHRARLGSGRDFDVNFAIDAAHAHSSAQNCLSDIDGHLAEDVSTSAPEEAMFFNSHREDRISRRATLYSWLPLTTQADLASIGDARRNAHGDLFCPGDSAQTRTGLTRLRDDGPAAITSWAGAIHGEGALGEGERTSAVALGAGRCGGPGFCARARTGGADILLGQGDQGLSSLDGHLEGHLDLIKDIIALARAAT